MDNEKKAGDAGLNFLPKPFTIQFIATSSSSSASASASADKSQREKGVINRGGEPLMFMFSKKLTPSDVGKLNRLVIPKQQAERYFPLLSLSFPYKGAQLLFLDRAGMQWHFRYCYWGSSQSYVMTRGWSRFVREYNLSPGDTVTFFRDLKCGGYFFIDFCHAQVQQPKPSSPSPQVLSIDGSSFDFLSRSSSTHTSPNTDVITEQERRFVRLFGVNLEYKLD